MGPRALGDAGPGLLVAAGRDVGIRNGHAGAGAGEGPFEALALAFVGEGGLAGAHGLVQADVDEGVARAGEHERGCGLELVGWVVERVLAGQVDAVGDGGVGRERVREEVDVFADGDVGYADGLGGTAGSDRTGSGRAGIGCGG